MMEIVNLPPSYSAVDAQLREFYHQRLAEIERRAREEAEPIMRKLAEIDAHYAPRMVITNLTDDERQDILAAFDFGTNTAPSHMADDAKS